MLTQCPQPAYTTFQYKFRASAVGTHMYHAHSAADAADGLAGAFIVRQSPRLDPLKQLYDVDATEHTIFVAEWGHSMGPLAGMTSNAPNAESLLINGKGRSSEFSNAPLSNFIVEHGKRYRFRLLYGGGFKSCPIKFSVDEHVLKVVALDGFRVKVEDVDSVTFARGERVDFILDANKVGGVYKMRVVADKNCQSNLEGVAELVYKTTDDKVLKRTVEHEHVTSPVNREMTTVNSDRCGDENVLCLDEMHSSGKLPSNLASAVDEVIYVPFNYSTKQISAKRVGE